MALILTDQFEKGVSEFNAVETSRLPKQDVELKEAVASLVKLIDNGPANPAEPYEPNGPGVLPAGKASAAASASMLIDVAQQKIGQADEVLERKMP